jgi:hypothetical protein
MQKEGIFDLCQDYVCEHNSFSAYKRWAIVYTEASDNDKGKTAIKG